MGIDLHCYATLKKDRVEEKIKLLVEKHAEVFSYKFLISSVGDCDMVGKEIALEEYSFILGLISK